MEARVDPDGVLAWNPHALLVARYLPTREDLFRRRRGRARLACQGPRWRPYSHVDWQGYNRANAFAILPSMRYLIWAAIVMAGVSGAQRLGQPASVGIVFDTSGSMR